MTPTSWEVLNKLPLPVKRTVHSKIIASAAGSTGESSQSISGGISGMMMMQGGSDMSMFPGIGQAGQGFISKLDAVESVLRGLTKVQAEEGDGQFATSVVSPFALAAVASVSSSKHLSYADPLEAFLQSTGKKG